MCRIDFHCENTVSSYNCAQKNKNYSRKHDTLSTKISYKNSVNENLCTYEWSDTVPNYLAKSISANNNSAGFNALFQLVSECAAEPSQYGTTIILYSMDQKVN